MVTRANDSAKWRIWPHKRDQQETEVEPEGGPGCGWARRARRRGRRRCVQVGAWLSLGALVLWLGGSSASSSSSSGAIQSVLLDTTEQSALGWTRYPDGGPATRSPGWVEESFTNFERGINWRSFVVCDVAFNSVNNWLWTPYLERGEANRLYIEIKFTMRDCNLFPQMVLSCKETFALLYKELEAPVGQVGAANASFAQSDSYTLVDAIAADEGRFTSNTDVVINTEVRSIPVSRRGVYFAFRDQGACLSLISIRVYHLKCPELVANLAHFNATPVGRDLTSLVAVEGRCVANSVQLEAPRLFCGADGHWNSMAGGQCRCLAGFEPAANQTRCSPCPPGTFKGAPGDGACTSCPEHSTSNAPGAAECRCLDGYFRAPGDPRSAPCTQAPGQVGNLSVAYADSSTLVLQWAAPRASGGRQDLTYRLSCDQCGAVDQLVSSPPHLSNLSETRVVLAGLAPATQYRFQVEAANGVSHLAGRPTPAAELVVQTARPAAQTTANTLSAQGGFQLLPIFNLRALPGARGSDMLLAWDVAPDQPEAPGADPPSLFDVRFQVRPAVAPEHLRSPYPLLAPLEAPGAAQTVSTTARALLISTLAARTEYAFQIRARWPHSGQASEFSEPVFAATGAHSTPPDPERALPDARAAYPAPPPPADTPPLGASSLGALLLGLLAGAALLSLAALHYRKSLLVHQLGYAPSYGAVYGSGASSDLMGGFGGAPAATLRAAHAPHPGAGLFAPAAPPARHSAGGAASAVHNFIAATLGHIGAAGQPKDGKRLFAGATPQHHAAPPPNGATPRNHYHPSVALGPPAASHTLLLSSGQGQFAQHPQELLKYRTLQPPPGELGHQLDPQLHIYDDLDGATAVCGFQQQRAQSKEIDPQRVSLESVIGRGYFGDVCLARLRPQAGNGPELRVALKTLRPQAGERARLDFLVEASVLGQFEHPNVVRLEAVVSKAEPLMIALELMQRGALDAYLRANKNSFTCLQLISMLRGIANGMQYLAKLNYVHKDLAARNVMVDEQGVCKIAGFGLAAHSEPSDDGYAAESTSSASSNTLSTTGSTPNTNSTVAAGAGASQLVALADQLAAQRFGQQQAVVSPAGQHQATKIPVRWTALEAIAFRRFTSASDVWSFGVVCWEVMTQGDRPYWNWSNQDVIKAIEQGYRLPQPDACPGELYQLMLDCWLKERAARPSFGQVVRQLERLLSPYDDPFSANSRISTQDTDFYDTYSHVGQLTAGNKPTTLKLEPKPTARQHHLSVDDWLHSIKMSKYKDNFHLHQINSLQYVARLGQADLQLIGVSNGQHLRKLLVAIQSLRSSASIGASGEGYLV